MTTPEPLDARGVTIAPGDTVIYGFGVGRSVALAEAVVLGEPCACRDCSGRQRPPGPAPDDPPSVSLTPSGRVRLRVTRRSYSDGEKPVVDVAPDRLVVLKEVRPYFGGTDTRVPSLPPSPLPTQAEVARPKIEERIARYVEDLRRDALPSWWRLVDGQSEQAALVELYVFITGALAEERRKLRALDE